MRSLNRKGGKAANPLASKTECSVIQCSVVQ
jgi:hypothetical protein